MYLNLWLSLLKECLRLSCSSVRYTRTHPISTIITSSLPRAWGSCPPWTGSSPDRAAAPAMAARRRTGGFWIYLSLLNCFILQEEIPLSWKEVTRSELKQSKGCSYCFFIKFIHINISFCVENLMDTFFCNCTSLQQFFCIQQILIILKTEKLFII